MRTPFQIESLTPGEKEYVAPRVAELEDFQLRLARMASGGLPANKLRKAWRLRRTQLGMFFAQRGIHGGTWIDARGRNRECVCVGFNLVIDRIPIQLAKSSKEASFQSG